MELESSTSQLQAEWSKYKRIPSSSQASWKISIVHILQNLNCVFSYFHTLTTDAK